MRITALKPQEHHPERVNVYVDGVFRCGLAVELAFGAGLRVGEEVTEETLADLERKDLLWKARESAFHLLGYRARAEAELRRRLLQKGFPEEIVEECVADLVAKGFVDDAEFAAAFVRDRVRGRPRGVRRLVQELRSHGVADETAQTMVDQVLRDSELSELDLARNAARAWARKTLSDKTGRLGTRREESGYDLRRRLYGHLARRGFTGETIRIVSDEVLGDRSN